LKLIPWLKLVNVVDAGPVAEVGQCS